MEQQIHTETPELMIQRLQAELAAERARAEHAEAELLKVKEAVHAFRVKQEQVARARKAREAAQSAAVAAAVSAAPVSEPAIAGPQPAPVPEAPVPQQTISSPTGTALAEALEHPDTELDARLDRFLEHGLEPDASREWMLED